MMKLLKKLFCGKCVALEKENQELKTVIEEKDQELLKKQEHINTTNAYWKKKLHDVKKKTKPTTKKL